MIGQTLGHYRIESKLGEGGMGVVYRALDTRLNRPVALKVLRPDAVANPERKRRFVQEAQAASALNHPNLITIYDIGVADGVDYMAMEYVAGQSLDRLIGRKGLRLGEALKYAVQIADGLAKAHGAGIVHRDLKPGNIMVNEDGLVKVLDFGLAKLTQPAEGDELAETVDARAAGTEEGVILGTVAYMSPEQAQGAKVDARSDIFSFGVVLYEMLSGRQAFEGENRMSRITAILTKEPELAVEGLPGELVTILSRCLRKDLARRFQHMDDVKIALEEVKEDSESGRLAASGVVSRRVWGPARIAVVALLLAATAGLTWWLTRQREPGRLPPPVLTRLTSDAGLTTDPALSADGKLLAYASDRSGDGNLDIWVQQVGSGQPIRLTSDPADDRTPVFSPDGRSIAFRSERAGGGIYVIPALGGDARLIAERGQRPRFSPDGAEIAYFVGEAAFYGQIFVVAATGGQPRRFQPEFTVASHPVWSPDGKRLLFRGRREGPNERGVLQTDWWVAPTAGGGATKVGRVFAFASVPELWLRDANFVLFSAAQGDATNVWRVPISPETGRVTGEAERLTSGAGLEVAPSVATGPDGVTRMAFSILHSQVDIWSLPVDANAGKVTGDLKRLTNDAAYDSRPAISQDGKKLVFLSNRSGNNDVWIKDLETGRETALTATPANEIRVRISADGSKVVYNQQAGGQQPTIYIVSATGGVPKIVCADCGVVLGVSSDAGKLSYGGFGTPIRLFSLDVQSARKTEILLSEKYGRYRPLFSSDGRWLVFDAAIGTDPRQVYVAPFRETPPVAEADWIRVTDPPGHGTQSDWAPGGNVVYYRSEQDGFLCIWARRLDPVTKKPVGPPFEVRHFSTSRLSMKNLAGADIALSVARDKLVFSMGEMSGNVWMAEWRSGK